MKRIVQTGMLLLGISLGLAGCASTGGLPRPFPGAVEPSPPLAPSTWSAGDDIAETALAYRGVPYRLGGSDPSGFDCSGFVWYVLLQHGIGMPRTVEEQFRVGRSVRVNAVQPGDLVFFRTSGRGATHVGLAISPDEFIHAPTSRGEVRVERLGSEYWARRFIAARRLW